MSYLTWTHSMKVGGAWPKWPPNQIKPDCKHESRCSFDHEYDLCGRCGLLWRKGTDDPPFLMIGYYVRLPLALPSGNPIL